MRLIYVTGKYRSQSEWELIENIRLAEKHALKLWKEGWSVICPHKNTAHFGGALGIPDSTWLDGDLEQIRRCDAIYMLPNWMNSTGAKKELELAQALGLEIIYGLDT